MGSKRSRSDVPTRIEDQITVPPGFLSRTSFVLKRLESDQEDVDATDAVDRFLSEIMSDPLRNFDSESAKASLSQMPFVSPNQFNCPGKTEEDPVDSCPYERVIQQNPSSHEVSAKLQSTESCLPKFDDAPVYHPSDKEFKDILKYIASIRPVAERYGLCRIVPPSSWIPPRLLEDKIKFDTESTSVAGPEFTMESYRRYADDIKNRYFSELPKLVGTDMSSNEISEHEKYLTAKVERNYWHLIQNPNEDVKKLRNGVPIRAVVAKDAVEYSDIGSLWNLSNLSDLPCSLLPFGCYGSSTISVPKLFIGVCFASQFWKNEDHNLYSLSYMHFGEPKVWYGVPGRYCFQFLEVAKKQFPQVLDHPNLLNEVAVQISPSVLMYEGIPVYKCVQNPRDFVLTFPGAFRYEINCGFNCTEAACFAPFDWLPHGQNIVELYGEHAIKTSISHDKLLLGAAIEAITAEWESLTKINNNQIWKSVTGQDGLLTKLLKSRVRNEGKRREHLSDQLEQKAFDDYDTPLKRECSICFYDLYLSAIRCACSPDRYSCLRHSTRLCSCAWIGKQFLYRYTMTELELLVQAVEGNLSAISGWAKKNGEQKKDVVNVVGSRSDSISSRDLNSQIGAKNSVSSSASQPFCEDISDVILILDEEEED